MAKTTNYPQGELSTLNEDFVEETINNLKELYDLGRPVDDAEVEERVDKYFRFCAEKGCRPGVEGLCMALSITRQTLHRWKNGQNCTTRRQQAVLKACAFINAFLEQSALKGRLNPATSIFLMKNWMGYSDNQSIEFRDNTHDPSMSTMTPEETIAEIKMRHGLLDSTQDYISVDDIRPECFTTSGDADEEEPEKPIL